MVNELISHQKKEFIRSSLWQKNVAINIIIGLFIIYMLANLLVLGFFGEAIIENFFPGQNPVTIFNSFLLFYFYFDLLSRFFLQEVPVLAIQPYLHLPLKRSKLVHFLQVKTIITFFNFLPLFCLIPFALKAVSPIHGTFPSLVWVIGIFILILGNGYFAIYLKRQFTSRPVIVLLISLLLVALTLSQYFGLYNISRISAALFTGFLMDPVYLFIPAAVLATCYYINYQFMISHIYTEEMMVKKDQKTSMANSSGYLTRFGELGELVSYEIKLMMRHKRTKTILYFAVVFLFYGLIFYPDKAYKEMSPMFIFVGIFITGGFMFNYGQFMISWEGNHFDALLAKNINMFKFFQAKLYFFIAACGISFILSLPYAYFGIKIIYFNIAALLFNIGINSLVVLYFGTINRKKIDMNKSSAFNYEGVSATQFILMIPSLLFPILLYLPFSLSGYPLEGVMFLGATGIIGMLFQRPLLNMIVRRFIRQKYRIASAFRQN